MRAALHATLTALRSARSGCELRPSRPALSGIKHRANSPLPVQWNIPPPRNGPSHEECKTAEVRKEWKSVSPCANFLGFTIRAIDRPLAVKGIAACVMHYPSATAPTSPVCAA